MQGKLTNDQGTDLIRIRPNKQYVIGRELIDVEEYLNLTDPYVSRRHGAITFEKDFRYEDAGSRNGSRVNGVPVLPGSPVRLADGDRLEVGKTTLRFHLLRERPRQRLPQGIQMKISSLPGGCSLQLETEEGSVIEHELQILQHRSDDRLPPPEYIRTLEGSRFKYRIRDAVSLREHVSRKTEAADRTRIPGDILRRIRQAEGLLLREEGFLVHPDTVFLREDGELCLIYLPCSGISRGSFREGWTELFRFLEEHAPPEQGTFFSSLAGCLQNGGTLWDCRKRCARIETTAPSAAPDVKKASNINITPGGILGGVSFVLFLAVYWIWDLSLPNLCGVGLVLAGINVLFAGLQNKSRPKAPPGPGPTGGRKRFLPFRKRPPGLNEKPDHSGTFSF